MTRQLLSLLANLLVLSTVLAQNGPGGVGSAANNVLWLRADNGVNTSGTSVDSWSDRSGNNNHAAFIAGQPTSRPILATGSANGYPTIDFDGVNDQLLVPDHNSLDLQQWDIFLVSAVDVAKTNNAWFSKGTSSTTLNYGSWSPNTGAMQLPIRGVFSNTAPTTAAGVTSTSFRLSQYNYSTWLGPLFPARRLYSQGTSIYSDGALFEWPSTNNFPLRLGAVNGQGTWFLNGDIAEMIVFNGTVNTTQRYIIGNYLAAKYGFTLTSNDIYVCDNAGQDYDHDVAGIGRVATGDLQTDSRGTGLVRINNPTGLGNNEFLLWGHNNGPVGTWTSTDFPPTMEGRWHRVWRVNEVNATGGTAGVDVGAVDMIFDLSGLSPVTAGHVRLLVDMDNDGVFADETPIGPPTSLGGGQYRFAGVTALANNRRFTLGTTDYDQTPLPVELVSFDAESMGSEGVRLDWATATEKNNDHFTVERSTDLETWKEVAYVDGAGTSYTPLYYNTWDHEPLNGYSYYRLKQTDTDGTVTLSRTVAILFDSPLEAVVWPVPFDDRFQVLAEQAEEGEFHLFDAGGRQVQVPVVRSTGRLEVDATGLVPGTYVLRLVTPAGQVTRTLVKF